MRKQSSQVAAAFTAGVLVGAAGLLLTRLAGSRIRATWRLELTPFRLTTNDLNANANGHGHCDDGGMNVYSELMESRKLALLRYLYHGHGTIDWDRSIKYVTAAVLARDVGGSPADMGRLMSWLFGDVDGYKTLRGYHLPTIHEAIERKYAQVYDLSEIFPVTQAQPETIPEHPTETDSPNHLESPAERGA